MLRLMREKFKSLQWILWFVIFAFVALVFVGWGMGGIDQGGGGSPRGDAAAEVDGRLISSLAYRRQLMRTEELYRQRLGEQADQFMGQLNLKSSVLQSLIEREVALREARRAGLQVSRAELRDYIAKTFVDEKGQFIGLNQVTDRAVRSGYEPDEFRRALADDLLYSHFQALVESSAVISDSEVRDHYLERNDKAEIEHVWFDASVLAAGAEPTDQEIEALFQAQPDRFKVKERKARYVRFPDADASGIIVTPDEIRAEYDKRGASGSFDEQRRARHILLKTDENSGPELLVAVEERARALVAEARAGADFASLAQRHSEDTGTASRGGDLGFFGKGAMVQAFEEAVFSARVGEVSDPVRTNYGIHVIKLEEIKPAMTLEAARADIEATLRRDRAKDLTRVAAEAAIAAHQEDGDLDALAAAAKTEVLSSGFFRQAAPPSDLALVDPSHRSAFAFSLFTIDAPGKLSPRPLAAGDSFFILQLAEEQGPVLPPLSEARAAVRQALRMDRGMASARAKAEAMQAALAAGSTLAEAAASQEGEVRTGTFSRQDQLIPGVPASSAAARLVYSLPIGTTSDAIALDGGMLFLRVTSRFTFDDETYQREKAALQAELTTNRGAEILQAIITSSRRDLEQAGRIATYVDTAVN